MGEAEQRDQIARYVAAYNRFDVDGMLAMLTDDVWFEHVSGAQVTATASGAAEFRALAEQASALFSGREQRLTGVEFRGGIAVASIAYHGVLAVAVPGGRPVGSVLELVGESEFGFEGGRICRILDRS
jgi:ketosteroid isomerase-like protein